jgi:FK506-binding protein 4/5
VTVHYVGKLHGTDDVFDSSRDRGEPFSFNLGKGEVIRGWEEGVATMRKGEKCVLVCRAEAAYGASGSPPKIPPNATLDFEVELLDWKSVKDVAGDGGLIKTVLAEGEGWQTPGDADEVVVEYEVRRAAEGGAAEEGGGQGGEKKKKKKAAAAAAASSSSSPALLSSPAGGATFTVRDGHLCRGLARAVRTMKVGEKARLRLRASDYASELLLPAGGAAGADAVNDKAATAVLPSGTQFAEVELTLRELHKVEIVGPGVVKKTLNEVDGWKRPNDGSTVRLRLRATLPPPPPPPSSSPSSSPSTPSPSAVPFWERLEGDELEVVLGEGQPPHPLPEALEDALLKMREGERCVVTVSDPTLAYGPQGWPDAPLGVPVPPNASPLSFDVEMVAVTKSKEQWEMTGGEKLAAAAKKKDRGNGCYSSGQVRSALKHYAAASELIGLITDRDFDEGGAVANGGGPAAFEHEEPTMMEEGSAADATATATATTTATATATATKNKPSPAELRKQHRELKKAVALNQSAAALKAQEWLLAKEAATKALDVDPSNAKGLYRRAQAQLHLGELVEAEQDVRAALDADSSSADVLALQKRIKAQMRQQDKKEAKMFGRMLAALGGKAAGAAGVGKAALAGAAEGGGEEQQPQEAAAAGDAKEAGADAPVPEVEASA